MTKLHVPFARSATVARPRIMKQIDQGLRAGCKLTLVSAAAGYGKSTLVIDWLTQYPGQHVTDKGPVTSWLSLDEADDDPFRFLTYFIAALQVFDSALGSSAAAMLQSPEPPSVESLLISLLNDVLELERRGLPESPFILVLDDYHLITAQAIHDSISFFLENMPACIHLVLITRSDPPLSLARLRARGQMTEIRQADLRFTVDEATDFLDSVMGLSLSARQVELLEARTEGWIAGLQLAALSMRHRTDIDEFVDTFSGSHRFVIDYLAEEVVQSQPENVQEFILQTSILERFNHSLCEAVTGQAEGQQTLEELELSNLFLIPLDDERGWFRYHHLFSEVMTNRLKLLFPDQISILHKRAAEWFEQNDLFGEAIVHALSANDYSFAADLIERKATELLRTGRISTLLTWLNKMPQETVNQRPWLSIYAAWVFLLIGKQELIEAHLSAAEKKLHPGSETDPLRGNIAAIRAYAAARASNFKDAVNWANQALQLLAEDDFPNRAVVSFVLGGVYYMQGDFPRAEASMKEASQLGERTGNIHVAVQALSSVGGIQLSQGKQAQAERTFGQALRLGAGNSGQLLPFTASALVGMAQLRLAQDDLVSAREFAVRGVEMGKRWVNVESQAGGYLALARIEKQEGKLDEAIEALEEAKYLASTHDLTPDFDEYMLSCETEIRSPASREVHAGLFEPLTNQEITILRLIAAGLSNREIGEELYLSVNTVKWHLKNIYDKLDVHSRVAAATRAQELGFL